MAHRHGVRPPNQRVSVHRVSERVLTNAVDPVMLAGIAADWPVPRSMPVGVAQLWERAVAQFRSGCLAYENFTDAVRTGFEAVDSALRVRIGDLLKDGERLTFGPLIKRADMHGRLTPHQHEWLTEYALHFRNELTHADGKEPMVLTPPFAGEMLEGIGRFLVDLLDQDAS
jgi:hypothetical protein